MTLAAEAMRECDSLQSTLTNSSPSSSEHTLSSAVDTLHALDAISNAVCSVIDAAELCRSVHSDPDWRLAADRAFHLLSDYIGKLNGDVSLYEALVSVTSNSAIFDQLSEEQRRMAILLKREFENDGIHLPDHMRNQIREISNHVVRLESLFSENIVSKHKYFHVNRTEAEQIVPRHYLNSLSPQSQQQKQQHKQESFEVSETVLIPSDPHICNAFLRYSPSPSFRETVYMETNTSCRENLDVLDSLIEQRHRLAQLLGFPTYAHRFLADKMLKDPKEVTAFLHRVRHLCKQRYQKEMEQIKKAKLHVEGHASSTNTTHPVHPWDVSFYSGLVKDEIVKMDGNERKLMGHFTVQNSIHGMKELVHGLFGITMTEHPLTDAESWLLPTDDSHGVRKFQFHHHEDGPMGTMYLDLHPRPGKYAHAAHFTVRCGCRIHLSGSADKTKDEHQLPIVALVCNLSSSSTTHQNDNDYLLSHSEVETLFHEFGHALHSLLSRTDFQHLSGTRAAMDFIETPSHLIEKFVWDKGFLGVIGKHCQTGEPIPDRSMNALVQSRDAFRATDVMSQVVYALFDQALFSNSGGGAGPDNTIQIFRQLHEECDVPYADGTFWFTRFGHLVSYGAGYYGYLFSQVFASDIWQSRFAPSSPKILNQKEGTRLWQEVLRHGGSKDPNAMLLGMLGREPQVNSFFDEITSHSSIRL